jgi:hypothetical protein
MNREMLILSYTINKFASFIIFFIRRNVSLLDGS